VDTQPKENKTEKPPPIILHGKFACKKLFDFCETPKRRCV
jgi:hypothetical protein